jgi:hypothetical protein
MASFRIELGGKAWTLPPLPWRIVREVQPALGRFYDASGSGDASRVIRLSTDDLDGLAAAFYRSLAHVEPTLSRDDFDNLPFAPNDLIRAIPALSRACGLIRDGAVEAAPDAGKEAATPGPD